MNRHAGPRFAAIATDILSRWAGRRADGERHESGRGLPSRKPLEGLIRYDVLRPHVPEVNDRARARDRDRLGLTSDAQLGVYGSREPCIQLPPVARDA